MPTTLSLEIILTAIIEIPEFNEGGKKNQGSNVRKPGFGSFNQLYGSVIIKEFLRLLLSFKIRPGLGITA